MLDDEPQFNYSLLLFTIHKTWGKLTAQFEGPKKQFKGEGGRKKGRKIRMGF